MPEHVNITDPEIHEPKGIATANAGEVYVADGSASGDWVNKSAYGSIYSQGSDSVTVGTIGTTAKKFEAFSRDGPSSNTTVSNASDSITVTEDGDYEVDVSLVLKTSAIGDAGLYEFRVRVDDVEQPIDLRANLSGTDDTTTLTATGVLSLTTTDVVTVWVQSDNGSDTDDLTVRAARLAIKKVS